MRQALKLCPDSRCDALARIEAEVSRPAPDMLRLDYLMVGNIANVSFPQWKGAARADELWTHTCFEAFLRPGAGPAYFEFNFSPSFQWQAYAFAAYREGRFAPEDISAPQLRASVDADHYDLNVVVKIDGSLAPARDAPWQMGLSAIIEETNGRRSHWALTHPIGKPDFHHASGFALELPTP